MGNTTKVNEDDTVEVRSKPSQPEFPDSAGKPDAPISVAEPVVRVDAAELEETHSKKKKIIFDDVVELSDAEMVKMIKRYKHRSRKRDLVHPSPDLMKTFIKSGLILPSQQPKKAQPQVSVSIAEPEVPDTQSCSMDDAIMFDIEDTTEEIANDKILDGHCKSNILSDDSWPQDMYQDAVPQPKFLISGSRPQSEFPVSISQLQPEVFRLCRSATTRDAKL